MGVVVNNISVFRARATTWTAARLLHPMHTPPHPKGLNAPPLGLPSSARTDCVDVDVAGGSTSGRGCAAAGPDGNTTKASNGSSPTGAGDREGAPPAGSVAGTATVEAGAALPAAKGSNTPWDDALALCSTLPNAAHGSAAAVPAAARADLSRWRGGLPRAAPRHAADVGQPLGVL